MKSNHADTGTRTGPQRYAYLAAGWICFGLGAVGVVLPGLPTTPLMLLALWAFSQSSQRFHDWLYHHPLFGPRLQDWHEERVIPLPAKITAWTVMAASLAYLVIASPVHWVIVAVTAALMLFGAVFIARCPSRRS